MNAEIHALHRQNQQNKARYDAKIADCKKRD